MKFAALVATQCLTLKTGNNVQLSVPALASIIFFSNVLKPRPNTMVPAHISLIPAAELHIREVAPPPSTSSGKGKKGVGGGGGTASAASDALPASLRTLAHCTLVAEGSGKLSLSCGAAGISHQAVLERRERQLQRQKKAAKRRRREAKERNERNAAREQEREQLRLQRLAERKAKKLAEREARRRRAEASSGMAPKTIKSSNSLTRLAAAGAAMESTSAKSGKPRESPRESFSDAQTATNGSRSGSRSPANGVSKPQTSAGNSELMAAMARRRAKEE